MTEPSILDKYREAFELPPIGRLTITAADMERINLLILAVKALRAVEGSSADAEVRASRALATRERDMAIEKLSRNIQEFWNYETRRPYRPEAHALANKWILGALRYIRAGGPMLGLPAGSKSPAPQPA